MLTSGSRSKLHSTVTGALVHPLKRTNVQFSLKVYVLHERNTFLEKILTKSPFIPSIGKVCVRGLLLINEPLVLEIEKSLKT